MSPEPKPASTDYDVNIRIITFIVISIFLMFMSIHCIKIYSSSKQNIMHEIRVEAEILENALYNDLNYSVYSLNIVARKLAHHYKDKRYIEEILSDYGEFTKFNTVFGWRKYSWVDLNFREIVTSAGGIIENPKSALFIKTLLNHKGLSEQIMFHISKTTHKNSSLKLITEVIDEKQSQYVGYVMLSYDIATIIRRLNTNKRNHYTNFVILDEHNTVLARSKPIINNIINIDETFSNYIAHLLDRMNFFDESPHEVLYLDMFNGVNYYIKRIKNLPFILIVNADNDEIKNNILDSIIKKFVEISAFTSIFLLIVISIYKRETYLRTKAEKATLLANRATKAKSDFLAFTAHEIRSPLGFISTGSEIMIKKYFGPLSDAYHEYAVGIHQNAKIILDFITDILDESQIIEGKFKIITDANNVAEIIENAIQVNQARANKHNIKINAEVMQNLPMLICDKRRMLQIMSNLLSNSIKYSHDNTTIIIKADIQDESLVIQVIDSGIGMNDEEISIALSNYGVILKENHNLIDSYGLGLPIVKMLLDAHGAELIIKSTPNIGTIVIIIFNKDKLVKS